MIFINMRELNKHQIAAAISNSRSREKALERYYQNPNICKQCGNVIHVKEKEKVREVKIRKFCNHQCSAMFNNVLRKSDQKVKKERVKVEKFDYILNITKRELLDRHGVYYKFRAVIRKHAHYVYNKNNGHSACKICGYDKHVEVCHIKSVSSFNEDALVSEINDVNNLIGLCPNHHWEFDNGLIML